MIEFAFFIIEFCWRFSHFYFTSNATQKAEARRCSRKMIEPLLNSDKDEYGTTTTKPDSDDGEVELTLDEVYEQIGRGPAQYIYWFVSGFLSLYDSAEIGLIGIVLPYLKCQWSLSPTFEKAFSTSTFIFYAIFSIAFGKITDKFGRKPVLLCSVSVLAFSSITSALAPNKWIFLIARSTVGACIGINVSCLICYATEFCRSKDRLIGMTLFNIGGATCAVLVDMLALLILERGGWRWLMLAFGLPMLLPLIFIALMPGSPRYFTVSGKHDEAVRTLRHMARLNNAQLPFKFKLSRFCTNYDNLGSYSVIFGSEHRRSLLTLSAMYSLTIFNTFACFLYEPLIFVNGCSAVGSHNTTRPNCSLTNQQLLKLAISAIPITIGSFISMILCFYLKRVTALRVSTFASIFPAVGFLFCAKGNAAVLVVASYNFFIGFLLNLSWVTISESFPTNVRSTAIGFINSCSKICGVLGSIMVSFLYYENPYIVPGFLVSSSVMTFIMTLIYNNETKDVAIKDT